MLYDESKWLDKLILESTLECLDRLMLDGMTLNWAMQRAECMSIGMGDSGEALTCPLAEEISANKPHLKSSNGGSKYMDYS
jgi:hypothetical protein